jgi:hypothetical protein
VHFRLDAEPDNLRVIREVPEGTLLRIQGRNGIGKTLFVRLLQLATGFQPYLSMPRAWQTLREGLGPCRIDVDGLKQGVRLELLLEPAGWPIHPEPVAEWLGAARRNGRSIEWADVARVLRVFRVGGDESLVRSLSLQVRSDQERVTQQRERLAAIASDWDAQLQPLLAAVDDLVIPTWDELTGVAHSRRVAADKARRRRKEALEDLDRVRRARQFEARLDALRTERPHILARLQELGARNDDVDAELARTEETAARVLAGQRQGRQMRGEITKEERLYRLRAERLQRRRYELAAALRKVGLHGTQNEETLHDALVAARNRLADVEARRASSDRAGLVVDLINSVDRPIHRAIEDDLSDEHVADIADIAVTVQELAAGLASRRATIESQTTEKSRQLVVEVERTRSLISDLHDALRIVRLLNKAESDLAETSMRLVQLAGRLSGASAQSYRQLQEQRASLVDELMTLAVERANLDRQLEELLIEGDEDAICHALAQLDVEETGAELDERVDRLEHEAATAAASEALASDEADAADARVERLRRALALALDRLGDDEFAWVARTGARLPERRSSPAEQQAAVIELHGAARSIRADVTEVLNDHDALGMALDNLARRISADVPQGPPASIRLIKPVTRYYERVFAQELAEPEMRNALFDGGSDVSLDLELLTTTWTGRGGERRSRPLEAFSSGEHAFAYTRLQLENVNKFDAENKVVFLDEFGAYVARDRLEDLFTFVRKKAIGIIADQVVVILPLTTQPRDQTQRAALTQNGYYVEAID